MTFIEFVGVLEIDSVEDSGCAIVSSLNSNGRDDIPWRIDIISTDVEAYDDVNRTPNHDLLKSFIGKKVKITVEVIE